MEQLRSSTRCQRFSHFARRLAYEYTRRKRARGVYIYLILTVIVEYKLKISAVGSCWCATAAGIYARTRVYVYGDGLA